MNFAERAKRNAEARGKRTAAANEARRARATKPATQKKKLDK